MTIIKEIGKGKKEVKVTGAKVEEVEKEEIKVEDKVELKPVEVFGEDKDSLEAYGLTFGINLNKSKKIENMYADLVAHINK